ncbi:hypothetical protein F4813DRAFT_339216 [Daldinia decipiens]|uniref:uncharacterized protein n=1 Tax=Daldinia decipiens TaxID=326647 RepID=UPI0020C4B6C5|nr:uncharacterized protein F4813DRAFT_339216 [Daldinia decipiens]KAI1659640.1 hypothetical protein F4813DRAFT_339216 [Daldinia decipiens]
MTKSAKKPKSIVGGSDFPERRFPVQKLQVVNMNAFPFPLAPNTFLGARCPPFLRFPRSLVHEAFRYVAIITSAPSLVVSWLVGWLDIYSHFDQPMPGFYACPVPAPAYISMYVHIPYPPTQPYMSLCPATACLLLMLKLSDRGP